MELCTFINRLTTDLIHILAPQECIQLSLRTVWPSYILLAGIHTSHSQYSDVVILTRDIDSTLCTQNKHTHTQQEEKEWSEFLRASYSFTNRKKWKKNSEVVTGNKCCLFVALFPD